MSTRQITIAIHTFDRAIEVKNILEQEGIEVELNNVNLDNPEVAAGVRVRIRETDLPKALLIVENFNIFQNIETHTKHQNRILVPTDFSSRSLTAAKVALALASKTKSEIEFLHAYTVPSLGDTLQLSDVYKYDSSSKENVGGIISNAQKKMAEFVADIKSEMKIGNLPPIKFNTTLIEGIPEEVIINHIRNTNPTLLIMITREAQKKEADLIGSVTAEVLDSCHIPTITIPENINPTHIASINHTVFLCNIDQDDILALDALYRMITHRRMHITLLNVPPRKMRTTPQIEALNNLLIYCRQHYTNCTFSTESVSTHAVADHLQAISLQHPFQLICLPNKHKNVVSRIFNPSLAHKLLFRVDIPMMVIPV